MNTKKQYRIQETLNLLMFADSSTDTKTDKNQQRGKKKKIKQLCHVSCGMCHVSGVRCQMSGVRYQVSGVTCHMLGVMCHI